ncbi:T9SS type A sorting domain-containing protein [bacterium]|nr:T9SS type A sorting domain-containing protein [bacterium]
MKNIFLRLLFSIFILAANISVAQVLTWEPLFPTRNDTITITYNAAQGNQGLLGETEVYAHTGVITDLSANNTDWLYVKAGWTENIEECKMQKVGLNGWRIRFHIDSYYGVPQSESIEQLALVFRNATSSKKGVAADGSDLFIPVYESDLNVTILIPDDDSRFFNIADTTDLMAVVQGGDSLIFLMNGQRVAATDNDTLRAELVFEDAGSVLIEAVAKDGASNSVIDSLLLIINPDITVAALPDGVRDGINRNNDGTVTLVLHAPNKDFIYAVGSFSDWAIQQNYYMNLTPDGDRWWITLFGTDPSESIQFQYWVNGVLPVADPYSELVLDPWNDLDIPESIYPDLSVYPADKTKHIVTLIPAVDDAFIWTDAEFERPEQKDLIIYELLIRDFLKDHSFTSLTDTLDYLDRLGINAIELLPVNEFEGNISWGYNTSFHFALDKYYGTREDFKHFVDAAHSRGIAVIMDMVLNHAFGQNSMARLYWDSQNNRPSSDNPWFNTTSPNNVYYWGNDFNHQSTATQDYVDRVLAWWIEEFHVDGYRLDFTKGFTNTPGDGGAYDAQRIDLLKRMGDRLWSVDPTAYIILEHFAENREEKELVEYAQGFLIWGNMNTAYRQSAQGWYHNADLGWGFYKNRGWSVPGLVSYMESHDEPWIMYHVQRNGRSAGSYNIQHHVTGLDRIKLNAAFFLTLPGPKMMWQFCELGYDQYLPESGYARVDPKPILWSYYDDIDRRSLYQTIAAINHLRHEHAVFRDQVTQVSLRIGANQADRRIHLSNDTMSVTILGNFNITAMEISGNFQSSGWWYDYLDGDSLEVTDVLIPLNLQPGEFRIYTDRRLETPEIVSDVEEGRTLPQSFTLSQNFPNPFNPETMIRFNIPAPGPVKLEIYNVRGQLIITLMDEYLTEGSHDCTWQSGDMLVPSSVYIYRLTTKFGCVTKKMIKMN